MKSPNFAEPPQFFHGLGVKFTGIQKILMSFLIFLSKFLHILKKSPHPGGGRGDPCASQRADCAPFAVPGRPLRPRPGRRWRRCGAGEAAASGAVSAGAACHHHARTARAFGGLRWVDDVDDQ